YRPRGARPASAVRASLGFCTDRPAPRADLIARQIAGVEQPRLCLAGRAGGALCIACGRPAGVPIPARIAAFPAAPAFPAALSDRAAVLPVALAAILLRSFAPMSALRPSPLGKQPHGRGMSTQPQPLQRPGDFLR